MFRILSVCETPAWYIGLLGLLENVIRANIRVVVSIANGQDFNFG